MIGQLSNPLDRNERLRQVQHYLQALGLKRYRVMLFGSVARGDFTAESDTDILVISDELPESPKARMDLLYAVHHVAPEVEPIGWREADWRRREADTDPFVSILKQEGLELPTHHSSWITEQDLSGVK